MKTVEQASLNEKSKSKQSNKTQAKKTTKRRNYKKELIEVQQELESLKEQHLRMLAEFDNYKKRRERNFNNLIENANSSLIEELLPVIDDFERSLNSETETREILDKSFYEGIKLILDKLKGTLGRVGLEAIASVGKPFDPEYHDALMQIENRDQPSNTVINEIVKGYKFKDKVLRHAKVVVSK